MSYDRTFVFQLANKSNECLHTYILISVKTVTKVVLPAPLTSSARAWCVVSVKVCLRMCLFQQDGDTRSNSCSLWTILLGYLRKRQTFPAPPFFNAVSHSAPVRDVLSLPSGWSNLPSHSTPSPFFLCHLSALIFNSFGSLSPLFLIVCLPLYCHFFFPLLYSLQHTHVCL